MTKRRVLNLLARQILLHPQLLYLLLVRLKHFHYFLVRHHLIRRHQNPLLYVRLLVELCNTLVNLLISFYVVLRITNITRNILGKRLSLLNLEELLFLFHLPLIYVSVDALLDEGQRIGLGDFEEHFVDILSGGFFIQFD